MKDAEDEAFDELAKRQGHWGGGFMAKKAMAADKLQEPAQEPVCDKDPQGCWNVRCQLGKQCKNLAQPVQEPVAWAIYDKRGGSKSLHWPENHSPDGDATKFDAVPLYTAPQPAQEPVAVHQFRLMHSADWHDGHPDPKDGHGPYETRTLYTAPLQRERVIFPTMLRKMWSGGEVQAWLDENVNKEKNG